jgi:TRAP-type C4-dicarboxylate transport system substrate-binding protein
VDEANVASTSENEAARQQMKKSGIEFVSFPEADYKQAASYRAQVIEKIKDKYISSKMINALEAEVKK